MRTLAIDYGTRRVGLALSDEGGRFATPLDVLFITTSQQATDEVLKVVAKEGVQRLLVGLPLNMDDSVGGQARLTMDWARDVAARAGLPLVFVDERLSSFEVEQHLADRKRGGERLTRQMKKERLDALVAAGLLQAFLDGRLGAVDV
ncbi:MAG TPA: Holliday junction resolvase RuvX [Humisphaera sp.]